MRPNATRRNNWAQLGIGAAALLLPPLALGAAFYSMLAEDGDETRPAVAQAAPPPPPAVAVPAGAEPAAFQPPAGKQAEDTTRAWERLSGQERLSDQERLSGQERPVQAAPIQMAATPAATVSPPADAEGGAAPPAADSPPATAAKKGNAHRHAPRPSSSQQDPFPVRTWLQQMGILPRNAKDPRG